MRDPGSSAETAGSRRRQPGSLKERRNPAESGRTRGGSAGARGERAVARGSLRGQPPGRGRVSRVWMHLLLARWDPEGRVGPGGRRRPVGPAPADLSCPPGRALRMAGATALGMGPLGRTPRPPIRFLLLFRETLVSSPRLSAGCPQNSTLTLPAPLPGQPGEEARASAWAQLLPEARERPSLALTRLMFQPPLPSFSPSSLRSSREFLSTTSPFNRLLSNEARRGKRESRRPLGKSYFHRETRRPESRSLPYT